VASAVAVAACLSPTGVRRAEHPPSGPTAGARADELIRSGITSKDPAIVAAVLADHAPGTPPSTIGLRHNMHHITVGRILAGVGRLTG
jgi:hypothetical protein